MMTDETIRFLLEQTIAFANTVANVCMLWWASSTVFCTSILSTVWKKRKAIKSRHFVYYLGFLLFVFFSSIIIFGFSVIIYMNQSQNQISALAASLGFGNNFYSSEMSVFRRAILCGTSSFILAWLGWVLIFFRLWRQTAQLKR